MPTLRDAIAIFRLQAASGEIVNRTTGQAGPFAASRVRPILSNVLAAVRHASRTGGRVLSEAAVLDIELDPFWMILPHHAELDAREHQRSDPRKEAANLRLFASAVTGRDIVIDPQPVVAARVPAAWLPLYSAIIAAGERGALDRGTMISYRRGVLQMAEIALGNGITRPEDLPNDMDAIYALGAAIERPGKTPAQVRKDVTYALTAYRRAADFLGATDLPRAYHVIDINGSGITSLPDLPSRLVAAGYTGDPKDIGPLDAVVLLAPNLGSAAAHVITEGRALGKSVQWRDSRIKVASWAVATLLRSRHPVDVRELTWLDLWTTRFEVEVPVDATKAAQLARYVAARADGAGTQMESRSLIRLLLEESAPRSYRNSPLTLVNPAHELDAIPVFTQQLQMHLEAAWMVTFEYFGTGVQAGNPLLWAQIRTEYEHVQKFMENYNAPRHLDGRKRKDRLPITHPQMLAMGLPYLAKKCYELGGRLNDKLFRQGHLDSRDSETMLNAHDDALRDYVACAFFSLDGLRVKNYANAQAGEQVVVSFTRTKDGEPNGISKLTTRWSGLDPECVKLKVTSKGEAANHRPHEINPAFFDFNLMWQYWTQTRSRALVKAGLVPDLETFDLSDDSWAVFPTPRPRAHQIVAYHVERNRFEAELARLAAGDAAVRPVPPTWRGNITTDMLSNIVGRAMHEICVEVLAQELPAYGDCTDEYRALFAAHIFRTQIACYWGGIRGDWARACWLTNDEEPTLRKDYNALQATFDAVANKNGPERPTWFDQVIDRAAQRHEDDDWRSFWLTFDPAKPQVALDRMIAGGPVPRPARARRAHVKV